MSQHHFASIGRSSDRGHRRERNEDAARVDAEQSLLVVADGMGGHPCGDVASALAADAVLGAGSGGVGDALAAAHAAVVHAADQGRGAPGMGTTCVACRCADDLEVGWVGDSRGYLLRAGRLDPLTRDHTEVERLVAQGVLSREQAARHPSRHMLARALGVGDLERDEIDVRTVPAALGDRVLLCSDGLTGELDEPAIAAILARHTDDQRAADALITAGLEAGGHDNITVIIATVG